MSTLGAIVSTQMERPKNRRKRDFGPSWRTAYVVRDVMTAVEHLQLHRIHQHFDVDPVRRRRISSKFLRHCCCAVQFGRDDADGLPTAIYLKLSSSFWLSFINPCWPSPAPISSVKIPKLREFPSCCVNGQRSKLFRTASTWIVSARQRKIFKSPKHFLPLYTKTFCII